MSWHEEEIHSIWKRKTFCMEEVDHFMAGKQDEADRMRETETLYLYNPTAGRSREEEQMRKLRSVASIKLCETQ